MPCDFFFANINYADHTTLTEVTQLL